MVRLWGKEYSKDALRQRVGDMSQLAGVTPVQLNDGPARGTAALEITTGTGFGFTVLPDRGMDISEAAYAGKSLCWRSCTGDRHPDSFQHGRLEWLRHFFGGLVLTCGLTQAGAPCEDGNTGEALGLHGRYTALAARYPSVRQYWDGDDFIIEVQGTMRDAVVFAENLELTRTIRTKLGSNAFTLHDRVENTGFTEAPFMLLYHCNFGFPVVDDGSKLAVPARTVQPRDPQAQRGIDDCLSFSGPVEHYGEQCFFYDTVPDDDGSVLVAIYNPACEGGFGAYLRYSRATLPYLTQWKMTGQGNYTCGLEPANCLPLGREAWRQTGNLQLLAPGEVVETTLEFGCLLGSDDIGRVVKQVSQVERIIGRPSPEVLPRYCDDDPGR